MTWTGKPTTDRMLRAIDLYRSTTDRMIDICQSCGVSRRGLSTHIRRLGISRDPGLSHKGGGSHRGKTGAAHPVWKGGRQIDAYGYVVIYLPSHPWLRGKNGLIQEHIVVAERMLGRRLRPIECVHHRDGDRTNNDPDNIQVMSRGDHSRLHHALRGHKIRVLRQLPLFATTPAPAPAPSAAAEAGG